jgi:large subunit ribosomal protein L4
MFTLAVYNQQGKEVERVKLDTDIFDGKINTVLLHQVVKMYLANRRKGISSTKTRGEVSGGGRKPWRQKGTGRARIGSIRAPHWKGGGVVFGPHPRFFSYSLPQRMKKTALRMSLNAKLRDGSVLVLEDIKLPQPRTKELIKILSVFKKWLSLRKKILFLSDTITPNLRLAANNIASLILKSSACANAYDVLEASELIITKSALGQITRRLKKCAPRVR